MAADARFPHVIRHLLHSGLADPFARFGSTPTALDLSRCVGAYEGAPAVCSATTALLACVRAWLGNWGGGQ